MSAAILVFLKSANLPTVEAWNAAIKAHGFDLVLDPFDPRTDSAYRPAMLPGRESGFEWYLSPLSERAERPGFPIKALVGDCDLEADLCYATQADENVAACIAAAVLAAMTGGYYLDPEYGHNILNGEQALAVARKTVSDWQRYGPGQGDKIPAPPVLPSFAAANSPPILASYKPNPLIPSFSPGRGDGARRADEGDPRPAINPRPLTYYRLSCGLMALIYIGLVTSFVLISRGQVDPPLSLTSEIILHNDPAARARLIEKKREDALGTGAFCGCIALFYCAAAFVPRTPWGWTVGRVAIIAMFFPFMITVALTIPLLKSWVKPETLRAFGR